MKALIDVNYAAVRFIDYISFVFLFFIDLSPGAVVSLFGYLTRLAGARQIHDGIVLFIQCSQVCITTDWHLRVGT